MNKKALIESVAIFLGIIIPGILIIYGPTIVAQVICSMLFGGLLGGIWYVIYLSRIEEQNKAK